MPLLTTGTDADDRVAWMASYQKLPVGSGCQYQKQSQLRVEHQSAACNRPQLPKKVEGQHTCINPPCPEVTPIAPPHACHLHQCILTCVWELRQHRHQRAAYTTTRHARIQGSSSLWWQPTAALQVRAVAVAAIPAQTLADEETAGHRRRGRPLGR